MINRDFDNHQEEGKLKFGGELTSRIGVKLVITVVQHLTTVEKCCLTFISLALAVAHSVLTDLEDDSVN